MILPLGFIIGSPLIGFLADRLNIGRNRILLIIVSVCFGLLVGIFSFRW